MVSHCVYIVRCSDNTLYTGYAVDVERRVGVHNQGIGSKYTRGRLPVILEYYEAFEDKSEALKREYEIKKFSKDKKEELIDVGLSI